MPISENCGGVIELLAAGVPTVASRVGGLPEVVHDGVTGWTVPWRSPGAAAAADWKRWRIPTKPAASRRGRVRSR